MFNKVIFFIAFRYWRVKGIDSFGRLVSNLASLGIILGVIALITVLSVMNGLEDNQKERLLTTIPHAFLSKVNGNFYTSEHNLIDSKLVSSYEPTNSTDIIIQGKHNLDIGSLLGVDPNLTKDPNLLKVKERGIFDIKGLLKQGSYNVIISSNLMFAFGMELGDKIRLTITDASQYTPFGRVPIQRLFNIVGIFHAHNQDDTIQLYANISDVGRLLRIPEQQFSSYRLYLNNPFQINKLSQFYNQKNYKLKDWREKKGEFFQAVKMEKNMMGLLISLIILIAIFNILISLSLMVVDKQNEIAILQTQGLNKSQVMSIFIVQGLLVSILGTSIGVILGIFLTKNINFLNNIFSLSRIELPTIIDTKQIIIIIISSLILSLLATIYPAYRASKIEPAETLRHE